MVVPNGISQKCGYALRALFELALRNTSEPVKIQDIASAQAIPPRFLEIILSELKHAGFVESRRGNEGGYILAQSAEELTVGEVISFLHGGTRKASRSTGLMGDYAFSQMWEDVRDAVLDIYNNTTFADLVAEELAKRNGYVPDYAI